MEIMNDSNSIIVSIPLYDSYGNILLPWETNNEHNSILSQDLMEQILQISTQESNFLQYPINQAHTVLCNTSNIDFKFDLYVLVFMKVLEIDFNLSRMHAKLIPKMKNEELFWFNYYIRIVYLRCVIGIDILDEEKQLNELLLQQTEVNADILTRKDKLTSIIQLKKAIRTLNKEDILFIDPIPINNNSTITINTTITANTTTSPITNTTTTNTTNTNTTTTNNNILPAVTTNVVPNDKSLLTSQSLKNMRKQLLDKELDEEVLFVYI